MKYLTGLCVGASAGVMATVGFWKELPGLGVFVAFLVIVSVFFCIDEDDEARRNERR